MFYPLLRWNSLLACCGLILATTTVRAQGPAVIQWRTSYAAAREESAKKNLPLLIYFTRPLCIHCDRMEQSTYRDARLLAAFGDKVIPLKINGPDQPELTQRLAVNLFPTIILARPDAQYETLVGYQEADFLHDKITRVLATLKPSEVISRDFDNAQKWESAGDYARAIAALRNILEDNKGKPLQKNAQELLQKIETRAEEQLGQAREFQAKGKLAEALGAYSDVQHRFAGLKSANDASELAGKIMQANTTLRTEMRHKRLRELTVQAEEFYKSKDFIPCLDRCEIILRDFGDLAEAQKAYALAAGIKNNLEWLQGAADVMTDRLGGVWLALADTYLKRGEPKRAEYYLQRVVAVFPGSRMAESAQIRLTQLQATMPTPTTNEVGATRP